MPRSLVKLLLLTLAPFACRAQLDPIPRNLLEVGYDQPLVGRGPQAVYAYYYYNRPDYFNADTSLRMAVAPAYTDSEIGFKHLLSPTTDVGVGVSGGGFGDNYYDVAQGQYRETQSFYGAGGGASLSLYQLVNPGWRIPLNLVGRVGYYYSTYFRASSTASDFVLPAGQSEAYTRLGLRFGGKQPLLMPNLGMELSAWVEHQRHFNAGAYGFDDDRSITPDTTLYWLYANLDYRFKDSGNRVSISITAGGSAHADLFSAWRLGGVLPLGAEFPLMLPGYYYEELTATRFTDGYGLYSVPLDPRHRWDFLVEAATAHVNYLPGYEQNGPWQTGAGGGIEFSPERSRYKVILRYGYGFNAIRSGKEGAHSVGLLFQYDFTPRKPAAP